MGKARGWVYLPGLGSLCIPGGRSGLRRRCPSSRICRWRAGGFSYWLLGTHEAAQAHTTRTGPALDARYHSAHGAHLHRWVRCVFRGTRLPLLHHLDKYVGKLCFGQWKNEFLTYRSSLDIVGTLKKHTYIPYIHSHWESNPGFLLGLV